MSLRNRYDRQIPEQLAKQEYRDRIDRRQRKSSTHDIPGYEYRIEGDTNNPGFTVIRFSKDMQYVQDWGFKLLIDKPFGLLNTFTEPVTLDEDANGVLITNPHTHDINNDYSPLATSIGELCIIINGFDLTEQLAQQYPIPTQFSVDNSALPIFPELGVDQDWDILLAAEMLSEEALESIIRTGEDKLVQIENKNPDTGTGVFNIRFQSYLQYSQTAR